MPLGSIFDGFKENWSNFTNPTKFVLTIAFVSLSIICLAHFLPQTFDKCPTILVIFLLSLIIGIAILWHMTTNSVGLRIVYLSYVILGALFFPWFFELKLKDCFKNAVNGIFNLPNPNYLALNNSGSSHFYEGIVRKNAKTLHVYGPRVDLKNSGVLSGKVPASTRRTSLIIEASDIEYPCDFPSILESATSLTSLTLKNNKYLLGLNNNSSRFADLKHLSLIDNENFNPESVKFQKMKNLKFLEIRTSGVVKDLELPKGLLCLHISNGSKEGKLHHFNLDMLSHLGKLKCLTLDHISFKNRDVLDLSAFNSLERLSISSTNLKDIKGIDGLPRLKTIILKRNNNLTFELSPQKNQLEHLELESNPKMPKPDFSSYTNLKKLHLADKPYAMKDNFISLDDITSLGIEKLSLSHLEISKYHEKEFKILDHLTLEWCKYPEMELPESSNAKDQFLKPSDVVSLDKLETLIIRGNPPPSEANKIKSLTVFNSPPPPPNAKYKSLIELYIQLKGPPSVIGNGDLYSQTEQESQNKNSSWFHFIRGQTKLTHLFMEGISEDHPDFSSFQELIHLGLSAGSTNFDGSLPEKLKTLDLSKHKGIGTLSEIKSLKSLEILDLRGTDMKKLDELSELVDITDLHLPKGFELKSYPKDLKSLSIGIGIPELGLESFSNPFLSKFQPPFQDPDKTKCVHLEVSQPTK